jgi:large subunit ribosomal protein L31
MREGIHPQLQDVKVTCACGNVIETMSTVKDLSISICSHCHPFFTGKQKLVDTAGRVERFKKRFAQRATSAKKTPAQEKKG